jgi:hypothetical protein
MHRSTFELPTPIQSKEILRKTELQLPIFEYHKLRIRMHLHTDLINILLQTINTLSEKYKQHLYIQGRAAMSKQVWESIQNSPVYRFLWGSRSSILNRYLYVPKDLPFSQREIRELAQLPFSPNSLTYGSFIQQNETAFYKAAELLQFLQGNTPLDMLRPYFGAINTFQVGSDTLSNIQLFLVRKLLEERISAETAFLQHHTFDMQSIAVLANFAKIVL